MKMAMPRDWYAENSVTAQLGSLVSSGTSGWFGADESDGPWKKTFFQSRLRQAGQWRQTSCVPDELQRMPPISQIEVSAAHAGQRTIQAREAVSIDAAQVAGAMLVIAR